LYFKFEFKESGLFETRPIFWVNVYYLNLIQKD